jgi:hypothetical protein
MKSSILVLIIMAYVVSTLLIISSCTIAQQTDIPQKESEPLKPPREFAKLSSILYELTLAKDWENFAEQHDIFLTDGKVRVFIIFDPASQSSEREELIKSYSITIEKKSKDLLRALVSINALTALSLEPIIWSINLPDKPVIPIKEENNE